MSLLPAIFGAVLVAGTIGVIQPASAVTAPTVVSLTFDNNTISQYTLGYQQALQPHGVPATFFVNSGLIGTSKNLMSWTQLSAVAAAGNEVGGKTVDGKVNLKTSTDNQAKIDEVCNDRQALIGHGFSPISFAYPFGAFDAIAESIVRNCGYGNARTAGSLSPGGATYAETLPPKDFFALRAYAPGVQITLANLESLVTGAAAHGGGWDPIGFGKVCSQALDSANYSTCTTSSGWVELADLNSFIDWLQAAGQTGGAPDGTVIKTVGAAATSADTSPPTTTITCNGAACATTTYTGTVTVALAATDKGSGVASTHYTTDGSDPTLSSPTYTKPFSLTSSQTVKYRSWDNAGLVEGTNTTTIQVQLAPDTTPPTTTITCNGAACANTTYTGPVSVTLTATDNAGGWGVDKTYYTTDGSTPTTASPVYSGPFTLSQNSTVRFFSTDLAGNAEQAQSQQLQIAPPKTVVSLTFDDQYVNHFKYLRPLLLSHNMHATLYVITSDSYGPYACCMSWSQLRTMQNDGDDIGGHGREHLNLTDPNTTYDQKVADVCGGRQDLIDNGISDPASYAYPFGSYNATAGSIVRSCGFQSARQGGGIASTTTAPSAPWAETLPPRDPYAVRAIDVDAPNAKSLADLESYVTAAASHGGGWLPITFHQVCDQAASDWSSCMSTFGPTDDTVLASFMDWLQNAGQPGGAPAGAVVETVREAMSAPDNTKPTTTALCNGAPCQSTPYGGSLRASLTAADPGGVGVRATYYTTDGSTPTQSSQLYSEPILLVTTTTLKFFSVDNAGNVEAVQSATIQVGSNSDPVIAAAGDIACDPTTPAYNGGHGTNSDCRAEGTSNLLVGADAVLPLGDDQYNCGGYDAFMQAYDPTWGRFNSISHPVPGDKEYATSGGTDCSATPGAGYYKYFGSRAGDPSAGYYSYDLGTWHVIALNTAPCGDTPGFCAANSAQDTWLKNDLAVNAAAGCTLAYYQNPRFSSTASGGHTFTQQLWQDLYSGGTDVVLSGDSHWYERFTPMDASGNPDPNLGIREIIAGTGGAGLDTPSTQLGTSVVLDNTTHGVLQMTLQAGSYSWKFLHDTDGTLTDSGNATCHGAPVPAVTLTSPADGATVKSATPTFSGAAGTASGDAPAVTVKVYAGAGTTGTPVQTLSASVLNGTWSVTDPAALAPGTYTAVASQSNSAGFTGTSAPASFTVDTSGPTVTVTAPANGATVNTATPRVAGTGSPAGDASSVRVSVYAGSTVGGTPAQTATAVVAGDGSWSTSLTTLGDGMYTLQAAQTDGSGNVGLSAAVTFSVDTTAPVVTISKPADGATVNTATPTVAGTADGSSQVTLRIYAGSTVGGTPVQTTAADVAAGAWSAGASTLTDGVYTVQASQTDSAGNTGNSAPVSFTVNTSGPAVTVTAPANGAAVNTATPQVAGTGSAAGDASSVRVSVYAGSTVGGTPAQTASAVVAGDGSWSTSLTALGDGTYTLQAAQTDGSGNVGTSTAVTFSVKTSAPAVTLTSPSSGAVLATATPTLSGAAGTAAGDSSQVTLRIYAGSTVGGTPVQTKVATVTAGAWSVAATTLTDRVYTAQATQTDSTGNTGTSAAVKFTIDTTAPVVTISQPANGATVTTSVLTVSGAGGTATRDTSQVTLRVYTGSSATGTALKTVTASILSGLWTKDVSGLANGTYTVQATQSDSAGNLGSSAAVTITLTSAYSVTSVSPSSVGQGAVSKALTISGTGFTSGVTVTFSGAGVTATTVSVTSSTSLAVTVNVGASASTGTRDVVVGQAGQRAATCAGCLTVNAGPKVTSLVPNAVGQGAQKAVVKVKGSAFVAGAVVTVSGSGVTDTVTATSGTVLTLAVTVASGAATGPRDVTVVQPDGGQATCTGCLTVNPGPTVTNVSPASIARGTSVTVTLTGTGFVQGAKVTVSGAGVTAGTTTYSSSTSMTVVLTATSGTATGLRSVTVKNPDFGTATLASSLTVT